MQSVMLDEIRDGATLLLDAAVAEVCEMILEQECIALAVCHDACAVSHSVCAAVHFSEGMQGICIVHAGESATLQMASVMLGAECNTLEGIVLDALSEMTNMISGAWKSRLAPAAAGCRMSVPVVNVATAAVDCGHKLPAGNAWKIDRCYGVGSANLHVTVHIQRDMALLAGNTVKLL